MNQQLLEQARSLHKTIHLFRSSFLRRHMAMIRNSEDSAGLGTLTLPQFNTLLAIRELGTTTLSQIAETMQVSAPSASAMVDRLVESGLLTRERNAEDRRTVLIQLTDQGLKNIDRMESEMLESIVEMLQKLGPEYSAMWCSVYDRMYDLLMAEEQGGTPGTEDVS